MFVIYLALCWQTKDITAFNPVSIRTRSILSDQSPPNVQKFLATPGNWPKIVSTSVGVISSEDVTKPLPVGRIVDEIFGLPPILPLSVQWTCVQSVLPQSAARGRLAFISPNGLENVARNCEMIFDVQQDTTSKGTTVSLDMRYEPTSILALAAIPVLVLDNAVALKFLLPAAMRTSPELDKFRNLMGTLYLGAGIAHWVDCVMGSSQLLTAAGTPTFDMLPWEGRLLVVVWCLMGPLSFTLSKWGGAGYADIGLILYGLVEMGCAGLVSLNYDGGAAFANSVLVQGVVGGAWFYSSSRD